MDLAHTSVISASLSGTILSVTLTGGAVVTYQVFGGTPGAVATSSDGSGGTDLYLTPVGSLWGESTFPLQPTAGSHLYGPSPIQFNSGIAAVGVGITPANFVRGGPDIVLDEISRIDPFLLPYENGVQAIPVSETNVSSFPNKFHLIEPVLNSTTGQIEQILFYETQDASGDPALNKVVINEGTGGANSPWTIGPSTQVVPTLPGLKIENLNSSFTNVSGVLSNYSVAWDQFDPVAQTDTIKFDLFNPNGSLITASPVQISSLSGIGSPNSLPAWQFRSAGGGSAYAAAVATNNANSVNTIQVQGYNSDGNINNTFHFTIQPDLSNYAPGATNQILDGVGTTSLQFAPNPTSGSDSRLHGMRRSPVKTAPKTKSSLRSSKVAASHCDRHSRFKMGRCKTFELSTFNYLGNNFEVLAYGDDTGTHVIEFDSNGHQHLH